MSSDLLLSPFISFVLLFVSLPENKLVFQILITAFYLMIFAALHNINRPFRSLAAISGNMSITLMSRF